jgi:hypothetical protein
MAKIIYHYGQVVHWLIIYCFTSRSRIFHLHGDVAITGEGLQNLRLCSVLRAFEHRVIHTCCDTGPRFFRSHSKDRPIQSPLRTHKRIWRIYSNPDPHGSPISRLLRHTRGSVYSNPDLHGKGCTLYNIFILWRLHFTRRSAYSGLIVGTLSWHTCLYFGSLIRRIKRTSRL